MVTRLYFFTIRAQVIALIVFIISLLPFVSFSQPLTTNKEKFLGCGTSSSIYRNLASYWNQVSPGNDGKWGSVENPRGTYNWTNLDKIYAFATSRGLLYKHHTLVWGSQQPSWLSGLDSAAQRDAVTKWINAVGARYPKMDMVDVVNEPLHTPLPVYVNALGGVGATGWDWVITSFTMARKACAPGVKLLLNDYNILSSTTTTTNFLAIIQLLKDRGLIDGIGVQGHYFEFRSDIGTTGGYVYDIPTLKANLDRLTATGLPVYITEFDIDEPIDANQLAQYKIYFPLFWNNPGVKGITFWGYIQDDVWNSHPNTYLIRTDGTERPALEWLRVFLVSPAAPVPVSPVAATEVARNARLVWQHSDSASAYHVQVSPLRAFQTIMVDSVLSDTTLALSSLDAGTTYYWRVAASNTHGASEFSAVSAFTTGTQTAVGEEMAQFPSAFFVEQNYPNPFNPSTVIAYTLPNAAHVRIRIFDPIGRECVRLVDAEQAAGAHSVRLEAGAWPSGIYYYRVEAGGKSVVKSMLLMK
jgi:endo-1,4-beta-xylanase